MHLELSDRFVGISVWPEPFQVPGQVFLARDSPTPEEAIVRPARWVSARASDWISRFRGTCRTVTGAGIDVVVSLVLSLGQWPSWRLSVVRCARGCCVLESCELHF